MFYKYEGHLQKKVIEELTGDVALHLLSHNFLPVACSNVGGGLFETTWRQNHTPGQSATVKTRQDFATPVAEIAASSRPTRLSPDGEIVY